MATLTIRNLDDEIRDALKTRGAGHGRSMEAEARVILATAVSQLPSAESRGLGSRIRERFAGLDFEIPPRADDLPRAANFDS